MPKIVSKRTLRRRIKQAVDRDLSSIEVVGEIFPFPIFTTSEIAGIKLVAPKPGCIAPEPTIFSLVLFLDEKDTDGSVPCEIVPNGWLSSDLMTCWWPIGLNGYSKAFPNSKPIKSKWKECKKLKIKFSSDNLDMVREWRTRYLANVDTSTVESESDFENDGLRPYQKGKCVNRPASESSSDENDKTLPKPPTVPEISFASQHDPNFAVATTNVQQLMLKKLELTSRKIDDLTQEVCDMKPMQPEVSTFTGSIPKHPAFTQEELEELNSLTLMSSKNAVKLAVSLSFVGGKSLKEATENVLTELMSNEVAMDYNWAGTKR
ncbi:unnamed protein product, partial [Allacma fusca]